MTAFDLAVWPASAAVDEAGVLTLGGIAVTELAREFGTPAYVLDEDYLRQRCRAWRAAFPEGDVYYGGKAFLCTAVARIVVEEGLHLDVCTGGELAVALRAGIPVERIGFHGNNKSVVELTAAVEAGVGRIVVDSFDEIARVAAIAGERGVRQRVLVRIAVGLDADTHEFIATAHEDQKFGFSVSSGAATHAIGRVLDTPSLELAGLHSHIGSQVSGVAGFEVAAHRAASLLARVRDDHGVELPELNLGGGLGIAYVPGDDPISVGTLAERINDVVARECDTAGLARPRLAVEPGRHIVGPSTVTLYEVGTVKPLDGIRTYVSVDGGISDNIRTALYGARYSCAVVSRRSAAPETLCRVVGKHCESGDIVVRDVMLPSDIAPGDLLAVAATGAYCRSLASNYNHVGRPPVVAVRDGAARVIVRRETIEDVLRLDVP